MSDAPGGDRHDGTKASDDRAPAERLGVSPDIHARAVLVAMKQGLDVNGWDLMLDFDEEEHNNLVLAVEAGVDLVAYSRVLAAIWDATWWPDGIDPASEILDAVRRRLDLDQYGEVRSLGVLHAHVVGAVDRGIDLKRFGSLVANGHPDTAIPMDSLPRELLDAHDRGLDLVAFTVAWRHEHSPSFSVPAAEIREALQRDVPSEIYIPLRVLGAAHADVLGALDRGIDANRYWSLMTRVYSLGRDRTTAGDFARQLLEADDRREDLDAFAAAWEAAVFPQSP